MLQTTDVNLEQLLGYFLVIIRKLVFSERRDVFLFQLAQFYFINKKPHPIPTQFVFKFYLFYIHFICICTKLLFTFGQFKIA